MADYGISLAAGPEFAEELARRAEAAGFAGVWTTESYDRTAVVTAAVLAVATRRVRIGTAIAYAFGRQPATLAAEAADLARLSEGRFSLGLGTAEPARVRDWLGVDPSDPIGRMVELVGLLRRLWRVAEGPVSHEGRHYRIALRPVAAPAEGLRIPVLLAAFGPRMTEAAAGIADGILFHPFVTPRYLEAVAGPALERGRGNARPERLWMPITVVGDDRAAVQRSAAAQVAFYGAFPTFRRVFDLHGFARVADALRATAWDWERMIDLVPPDVVAALTLAGTPAEVRDLVAERSAWFDHVILHTPSTAHYRPPGAGLPPSAYRDNVEALLDTFGDRPRH